MEWTPLSSPGVYDTANLAHRDAVGRGGHSIAYGCLDFAYMTADVGGPHVVIHDEQDIGSADCDFLGHRHTEEGGMEDREQ